MGIQVIDRLDEQANVFGFQLPEREPPRPNQIPDNVAFSFPQRLALILSIPRAYLGVQLAVVSFGLTLRHIDLSTDG